MKKVRLLALVMALALAIAVFAGCSSDASTEESPADTSSQQSSEEPSESTEGGKDFAALAEQAAVSIPSEFQGPTEKAIPKEGIKVGLVPSDAALSGPVAPLTAFEEAAAEIGWETQMYNGKGAAADQNQAIMDAISWGADAVVCASVDARSVQQALQLAQEQDVIVCSVSNGTDSPNEPADLDEGMIDFAFDVGVNYYDLGVYMADWIAADSDNAGKLAVYGASEYPSCMMTEEGLMDELATTGLTYNEEVMYFTGGQVGDALNNEVIGYLQANPDTEYIFLPYDPAAIEVCNALTTAGYTDVKVCAILGTEAMQTLIADDASCAVASAGYDMYYMGWAGCDQLIRLLNGQDLFEPHGENVPLCILDASNVGEDPSGDWVAPFDYKEQFLALWQE